MPARPAFAASIAALLVAGCASPAPSAPAPAASTGAPTTAAAASPSGSAGPSSGASPSTSATTDAPASPSITLGAPAPSPSGSAAAGTPQGPSLVVVPPGGTAELGLANAFHSDGWRDGYYQPAAASTKQAALAASVNCGQAGVELEYRFAPTSGTLAVSVAQDVLSDSSDNTVGFTILTDGRSVAEKAISFKQTAELTAPLDRVTVVKIVAATKGACRTSSTALITSATVRG